MTPDEVDKLLVTFQAMWPTPKLTDPQLLLWSDRFKAVDATIVRKAMGTLEKACKRRPSLAEYHDAVALAQTSGGEGATLRVKSSYWAMAWHVDATTSAGGESIVSSSFATLDELQDWMTLARGRWGTHDRFQLDIWRRDVTGPGNFTDHSLVDQGLVIGANDRRQWIQDALTSMAVAHTAPRVPYRENEPF